MDDFESESNTFPEDLLDIRDAFGGEPGIDPIIVKEKSLVKYYYKLDRYPKIHYSVDGSNFVGQTKTSIRLSLDQIEMLESGQGDIPAARFQTYLSLLLSNIRGRVSGDMFEDLKEFAHEIDLNNNGELFDVGVEVKPRNTLLETVEAAFEKSKVVSRIVNPKDHEQYGCKSTSAYVTFRDRTLHFHWDPTTKQVTPFHFATLPDNLQELWKSSTIDKLNLTTSFQRTYTDDELARLKNYLASL